MNPEPPSDFASQIRQGQWLIVGNPSGPEPGQTRGGFDFLVDAAEHKLRLALLALGGGLLFFLGAQLLPNQYTGIAAMLPPQQSRSAAAAALGQLGDLGNLVAPSLTRNPNAIFVSLLESRTLADRLVERFDLMKVYGCRYHSQCRQKLKDDTTIQSAKDGTIRVQVSDGDPRRAADLANAYIEELGRLNQTLAVGEAAQRRVFFENQVKDARAALQKTEEELSATQKSTGVMQLDAQTRVYTAASAELRSQIARKELQLDEMRKFATADNPDFARAENAAAALRARLERLENGSAAPHAQITSARMAETGLEYLRRLREVKYREAVFEVLAKQLEAARLDEAKNGVLIQVLDRATVPDRKSGPPRGLIGLAGLLTGLAAGGCTLAARRKLDLWQADPEICVRLEHIKDSLRPKAQSRDRSKARPSS